MKHSRSAAGATDAGDNQIADGDPSIAKTQIEKIAGFVLRDAPGHLLRRNHQRSFDIFQKHVGDGVTRQQFALLIALSQRPGTSQKDLVEATGIDKSTMNEMLSRAVDRGWVSRKRDPNDNRAWAMHITGAGQAVLSKYIDKVTAAQREILEPLSPADRVHFVRILRALLAMP